MKKQRDYSDYLNDILNALTQGIAFIKGMSLGEFSKDEKTQFAVIRAIEVVGEASKKIPVEVKNQSSEIPWKNIGGMRDMLIHDYFGVNISVVWETANKDFPDLRDKISNLIKDLSS